MTKEQKKLAVLKTAAYAKKTLGREATGHDWLHVERVWRSAKLLARGSGADLFVVELAALLHDIADWKFHGGDASVGPRKAAAWLKKLAVDAETAAGVVYIVENLSFKGAKVKNSIATLEGKLVQDADRLDAIGAIGVARAFAYGGAKGREIYNPDVKPVLHASAKAYSKGAGPTLNHFHEKLLLLKDRMNTAAGRRAAAGRHRFLLSFMRQFDAELKYGN